VPPLNRSTGICSRHGKRRSVQKKMASVGLLAAGTAHEIGTPLASVMGYAEILPKNWSITRPMLTTSPGLWIAAAGLTDR